MTIKKIPMGPLPANFFRLYIHIFIRSHLFGVAAVMRWLTPWKFKNKEK